MKSIFILSMICGLVMGSATVFYVALITKGMEYKKRIKVLMWIGVPAGCLMSAIAVFIGGLI